MSSDRILHAIDDAEMCNFTSPQGYVMSEGPVTLEDIVRACKSIFIEFEFTPATAEVYPSGEVATYRRLVLQHGTTRHAVAITEVNGRKYATAFSPAFHGTL